MTLTNDKGKSTSNIGNYSNPVRLYANSSVTVAFDNMTKIVFTCASASYATALVNSTKNVSGATVSSSGSTVTVEFSTPVNEFTFTCSAQVRVNSLAVTYVIPKTEEFKIKSAKLELSQDVSVIYTAIIPDSYTDHRMVFEFCGSEYTVYGTSNGDGTYAFKFDKVLPQCMGDNIKATLYATANGKEVSACINSYSVRKYC